MNEASRNAIKNNIMECKSSMVAYSMNIQSLEDQLTWVKKSFAETEKVLNELLEDFSPTDEEKRILDL